MLRRPPLARRGTPSTRVSPAHWRACLTCRHLPACSSSPTPVRCALPWRSPAAFPSASLWAFKIDPGTRITLHAGRDPGTGLWGEIVEVAQP